MPSDEPLRYDAVLVPQDYPPARTEDERMQRRKALFAKVLGGARVYPRRVPPLRADLLTARHTEDTPGYYFPKLSPRAGEERHDWTEPDADGVRFGRLKPEEDPPTFAAHPGPAGPPVRKPGPAPLA